LNRYAYLGVTFSGTTILSQGGSLNFLNFPPKSCLNVIYNDPNTGNGIITITFDKSKVGLVTKVGGYVTGNRNVQMIAYDDTDNVIGVVETGGANYVEVGTPNKLLEISTIVPIKTVTYMDGGNTYTVDDFYFSTALNCQVSGVPLIKQGHILRAGESNGGTVTNPWTDPYTGKNATIKDWGCALTSATMIVNYFGILQNGFQTDPKTLNKLKLLPLSQSAFNRKT
jgi:hypothetical protein